MCDTSRRRIGLHSVNRHFAKKHLMNRRQILTTFNAIAIGTLIPAWNPSSEGQLIKAPGVTQPLMPPNGANMASDDPRQAPKIGVVAVGRMGELIFDSESDRVPASIRSIAIDRDPDSLDRITADHKILLASGLSVYEHPEAAVLHAKTTLAAIDDAVAGLDLAILAVGLGGTTGTTIAPLVARMLRSRNILTLGVATLPFAFEGEERRQIALAGIGELTPQVNSLLPIFNTDIEDQARGKTSPTGLRAAAPVAIIELCQSVATSLSESNLIEVGIEDLRYLTFAPSGICVYGYGYGKGANAAMTAARQATTHPLLGQSRLKMASTVLICIKTSSHRRFLRDVSRITEYVMNQLPVGCKGIYSVTANAAAEDFFRVSILTGGICGRLGNDKPTGQVLGSA